MKPLKKHTTTASVGQALLSALNRKQEADALAKVHRDRLAKASKAASPTPVFDHRGQINEAASLIKAVHLHRATKRA